MGKQYTVALSYLALSLLSAGCTGVHRAPAVSAEEVRCAGTSDYEFIIMAEDTPELVALSTEIAGSLRGMGYREHKREMVASTDVETLYAYDREAGHFYLRFHESVPETIRTCVTSFFKSTLKDRKIELRVSHTIVDDYFLLWMLQ